jgi:hypothetical protein
MSGDGTEKPVERWPTTIPPKSECWDSLAPEAPIRACTEEHIHTVFGRMRSVVRLEVTPGGCAIFDAKYGEALTEFSAQKQELHRRWKPSVILRLRRAPRLFTRKVTPSSAGSWLPAPRALPASSCSLSCSDTG